MLGLLTARGGSKRVPGKNVRSVLGKPLVAWTVEAARQSTVLDRIVMSTDDDAIAAAASAAGADVPFRRPTHLASDLAGSADVVVHALEALPGYDLVVLLQPTSPLRAAEDIDGAIRACVQANAPACVSVTEAEESPYWMFRLEDDGRMRSIIERGSVPARSQDLPCVYVLNGAVYVARTEWFAAHRTFLGDETVGYVMPRSRSIDIDTEADFKAFERLVGADGNG